MSEILLSICIPTYNRADFLDYLLEKAAATWGFPFAYEIVISDNASTDDTQKVVRRHAELGLPIRYFRQTENMGGGPNVLTVYHRAQGRYVIYLADDDLLIPEAITEALNFLQSHPEICALYAPWQLYDDIDKQSRGNFFEIGQDAVYGPGQEEDVFNLIVGRHIFPEIVIFRADAARRIFTWPRFCFYPFVFLADNLALGPIAFRQRPFYRSVLRSPVRPSRGQAGIDQAMTDWDNYRGGLEYFLHAMLRRRGATLKVESRPAVRDMMDAFIVERMRVAVRLWIERGHYLNAYDLVCRLNLQDPAYIQNIPGLDRLPLLVIMQKLAHFANTVGGIDRLDLVGVEQADYLIPLLRHVGLAERIALVAGTAPPPDAPRDSTIVFIAREADRTLCLGLGYLPNLVVSETELTATLYLPA